MSFAKRVKEELVQIQPSKEEALAEFSAMIELGTELAISERVKTLWFKSNNPTVARRFLGLLKGLYKVENTLLTKKQGNFKKGYQIQLGVQEAISDIMVEHSLFGENDKVDLLIQNEETIKSYLRGAFLTTGSVNDPKTSEYHLEIYSENKDSILRIQRLMNEFGLNAKITKRRNGLICYLKDVTSIEDFLRVIGASDTVFEYEDIRIKRDFNNSINRVLNCEIANEKKTIQAANIQMKYIDYIEKSRVKVDYKILQAMEIRKENPDASLNELVEYFEEKYKERITKSGLSHRFSKLKEIAEEIMRDSQ